MTDWLEGIDVSKYNAVPSRSLLQSLSFAFARASYATQPDPRFREHLAAFEREGLVTGAYHFGVGFVTPTAQVETFISAGGLEANLIVLDWERDTTATMMLTQARRFISTLRQRANRPVGLYASESFTRLIGQDYDWIAKWGNTPPFGNWTFWQYQGAPLDRNRFNGSEDTLRRLARTSAGLGGTDVRFISASGVDVESAKVIAVKAGTPLYTLDGEYLTTLQKDARLTFVGNVDASSAKRAVLVTTGRVYADKKARPTVVMVREGEVTNA